MVNSLKHALELPRSSAMNNQDKCDPDWIGWHVLYGVLIPLYIVVGFSCSKTKHRTSLSVSESSTHLTLALFFFLQNQSLRGSENFQGVPAHAPPRLSPPGGFHPDRAIWARGRTQKSELLLQVSCTKLCLDTHTCISKPITSKFQIAVQSICKMPKWTPPARNPSLHQTTLIPLISTALLRGW